MLVRKGLIEQTRDLGDQREKMLHITPTGTALWDSLPNPVPLIASVATDEVDPADLETVNRVLGGATRRLIDYKRANPSSLFSSPAQRAWSALACSHD